MMGKCRMAEKKRRASRERAHLNAGQPCSTESVFHSRKVVINGGKQIAFSYTAAAREKDMVTAKQEIHDGLLFIC